MQSFTKAFLKVADFYFSEVATMSVWAVQHLHDKLQVIAYDFTVVIQKMRCHSVYSFSIAVYRIRRVPKMKANLFTK